MRAGEAALNKAPEAFRTISEVAEELDLPQHVLRFWESRFAPIKPMKRGGGRRYYRPEDVDLLRGIRHLLYGDGYTIRGVQRILREQGVRAVQSIGQGHKVALPEPLPEDEQEEDGSVETLPPLFGGGAGVAKEAQPPVQQRAKAMPAGVTKTEQPILSFVAASASAERGFSPEDLDRLKAALASLEEVRRLLDTGPAS